jgi:hypothetical protein
MVFRLLLVCTSILVLSPIARADAGARLISGGDLVALVKGAVVRVHAAADGRFILRLGPADDPGARAAGPDPAVRDRIFDRLGVPEEARDGQAAEDLVEDEATLAERRASAPLRPPAEAAAAAALAAPRPDGLLVAAGGRLLGLRSGASPAPAGRLPPGITALAPVGAAVWLARGRELLALDAGGLLRVVARADQPIEHLVASPRGWVAWAAGDTLTIAAVDGPPRSFLAPGRLRALAACGPDLVILADDGVHVAAAAAEAAAGPGPIAGPIPAGRLSCAAGGDGPWVAVGPGLYTSGDRGRTWRPRIDAPAVPLADAALAGGRLWLLTASGALLALPLSPSAAGPLATAPAWAGAGDGDGVGGAGLRARRSSAWLTFLPRLALAASHTDRGGRAEQRLLMFADFPLQPPPPAPGVPSAPPPPLPFRRPAIPAGPDLRCLPLIRARAVERALADPARARSLVNRAGRSAWLPELRVRVERRLGRNESLDVKPAVTGDALGLDTADDVRYEVRATWDLPRLVFNPEEVAAQNQALKTAEMRREIESQVNRLFFEHRRLIVQAAPGPAEDGERLLRLEELAAELDALSGGGFAGCGQTMEPPAHP